MVNYQHIAVVICNFFFFSSRRRHTRLQGDWSSDVCSSDLLTIARAPFYRVLIELLRNAFQAALPDQRLTIEMVVRRDEANRITLCVRDSRSEEHSSELQSPCNLVCRLLLEKKK